MRENNLDEREIDLVQMFKYLWKHLQYMCLGAIIGFALMFGIQNTLLAENETVEDGEKTAYEKEMEEYEQDYAQLEMEIENLEKSIDEQITYNNESILMKVNPYDKKSVSGQFYIDANYQIMPEMTYQNIDITKSVSKAYQALYTTGELARYINQKLDTPIKERYLNELISVNYLEDATLEVTVVHTDLEKAKEIYDLVIECMNQNKAQFEKTIGAYTITVLNESENGFVDLELKETQVSNLEVINTLKESLTEKRESIDALVMPTEGVGYGSVIVGAFLGFVIVFVVYVVLFLIDSTIKNEKDVAERLGLPVLGSVPVLEGKKREVKTAKRGKSKRYAQYGRK